jgi:DNA polymerase elongation subunit (family B)
MHEWVIDIDIASSYPSHIITLNMSNETYFGRIVAIPEHMVVKHVRERKFPQFHMSRDGSMVDFDGEKLTKFNTALKKGLFAIAPCGSVFKTSKDGVIAQIERNVFNKRRKVKAKMKDLKTQAIDKEGDEKQEMLDRAQELFALQWSLKILLNAMFGITSVPYSRYFNVNIAEAITSCGRWSIKAGEQFCNELLSNPTSYEPMKSFLEKYK